ncbi:hypothetical protein OB13_19775 [Pontibacter sp. HJ8]
MVSKFRDRRHEPHARPSEGHPCYFDQREKSGFMILVPGSSHRGPLSPATLVLFGSRLKRVRKDRKGRE